MEDDYKVISDKLEEQSRKTEIAEEVYFMYSCVCTDREQDLFEEVLSFGTKMKGKVRNSKLEAEDK